MHQIPSSPKKRVVFVLTVEHGIKIFKPFNTLKYDRFYILSATFVKSAPPTGSMRNVT